MKIPRTPGAGISGAWISSLGGDRSKSSIADTGSPFNDGRTRNAAALDREADAMLFLGRHAAAECLSNEAADLRQEVPA